MIQYFEIVFIVSVKCFFCLFLLSSRDCSGWIEVRQWWRSIWLFLVILYRHRLSSLDHVSAWLLLILYLVSGFSLLALIFHFLNISLLKYYLPSTLWRLSDHWRFQVHVGSSSGTCLFPIMPSVEVFRFVCCCDFYGSNLL